MTVVVVIGWLLVGLLLLVLEEGGASMVAPFAVAGLAHSTVGFWNHGRGHLTAAGIFLVGTAVFGFYPALIVATRGPYFDDTYALPAVAILFFGQVVTYGIWWAPRAKDERAGFTQPDARVMTFSFWTGITLVVMGIVLHEFAGFGSNTPVGAAAFVGVVLTSAAVILRTKRLPLFSLLLVLAVVSLYVVTMFSGGGRLVLGGMAAALALLVNIRWPGRWLKVAMLVGLPIGLILLADFRAEVVYIARGGQSNESGFESVLWPFERFSQLVGMVGGNTLPFAFGATFLASALFFVPRAIWPEKSEGFGMDLTRIFRPELEQFNHSEAALFHGEWIYNFGFVGLILMVIVVGWVVAAFDRHLSLRASTPIETRRDLFYLLVVVILTAGLFDLVWMGTAIYASRTGWRLATLVIVCLLFMWKRPDRDLRKPIRRSRF